MTADSLDTDPARRNASGDLREGRTIPELDGIRGLVVAPWMDLWLTKNQLPL